MQPRVRTGLIAGGIGTALCFGIIGALLAAGAGAGAGYLGTSESAVVPRPNNPIS